MIGDDGQPMTKEMIRAAVVAYNAGACGSKEFAAILRALV